ncbi:hypothetical protein [Streptomyces sp. NPDC048338]|uniref:hypothetical protein n=1 Tax=Streptomyces sp. NPDC048338 TaxID=3365536 RepID=UPI00371230CD
MSEEWLEAISDWLEGNDFVRSGGPYEEFDDVLLKFKRTDCEVHVSRDRGKWFISLTPPGGTPPMGPYVWRHYLDSVDPDRFRNPESLQEELDFVYSRLGEVAAAIGRDKEIGIKLRAINHIIVSRRLGLDPVTMRRKKYPEGE